MLLTPFQKSVVLAWSRAVCAGSRGEPEDVAGQLAQFFVERDAALDLHVVSREMLRLRAMGQLP